MGTASRLADVNGEDEDTRMRMEGFLLFLLVSMNGINATEGGLGNKRSRHALRFRSGKRHERGTSGHHEEDGNTQSQEERVVSDNNTRDAGRHGATGS
jgi:hypothetical protein